MSFKEIFDRYQSKQATESEIEYVEKEIEKINLITDYIEDNDPFKIKSDDFQEKENHEELAAIKQSMRNKNRRTIFIAVTITLWLLIIANLIIIPFLNNLFYNPQKRTMSSYSSDFEILMEVFHELHFSEPNGIGVTTDRTGIGEYQLTIMGYNSMKNEYQYQIAKLKRGKLYMPINYWENFLGFNPDGGIDFELVKEYLSDLPSYLRVSARVSFNRDLTMEELIELCNKFEASGMWFTWAGIRNAKYANDAPSLAMGFDMVGDGSVYKDINEKYPDYEYPLDIDNQLSAEIYKNHVKSLLQIMIDNKEFLELHDSGISLEEYYKASLEYINNNGVLSNGTIVNGTPESILKLSQENFVGNIEVNSVRFK